MIHELRGLAKRSAAHTSPALLVYTSCGRPNVESPYSKGNWREAFDTYYQKQAVRAESAGRVALHATRGGARDASQAKRKPAPRFARPRSVMRQTFG